MALKRTGLQPVGTVPQYAKTSGNAYSKYGSSSSEQKNDKGGMDPGMVNAGILGAMAAKGGYDWADKNGYVDKAKNWMFGPEEGSSYFAPGGAGAANNPGGMQASGPWGNASGHFTEGAAGTGFGNGGMNVGQPMANGGQYAMNMNAGADLMNAGIQAQQGAQAASAAAMDVAEMTPEMMLQFGAMA